MNPYGHSAEQINFNVFASHCPSRATFESIFSRWGMLILMRLSEGSLRFGALRRAVDGISEKMLSQTLKILEEEGMVERFEWEEKPPRVEYRLSPSGEKIAEAMDQVVRVMYGELANKYKEKGADPNLNGQC